MKKGTTETNQHGAKSAGAKSLTLVELADLCDDPARDLPGGVNVRALLSYVAEDGFYLSAQDGEVLHQVIDEAGKPVRFRTIEAAMTMLQTVPGLQTDIGLFQGAPKGDRH